MTSSLGALEVKSSFCVLLIWVFSISVSIVEHVNSNEISHFVIHLLSFAQLEGEVFVFIFLMAWIGFFYEVVEM